MRHYHVCVLAVLVIFLGACKKTDSNKKEYHFPEKKEFHLQSEKIAVDEIWSPVFMTYKDGFLVISSYTDSTTIHLYKAPLLEYAGGPVKKGRGPNEIPMFAMFSSSSNEYLYIFGYTMQSLRKIKIREDGKFDYIETFDLGSAEQFNGMTIINDSIFIYMLPQEMKIKKYDLINKEEVAVLEMPKGDPGSSFQYYPDCGTIAANDSYLIYAYSYRKEIDIYDVNTFKLVKKLTDGKEYTPPTSGVRESVVYQQSNVVAEKNYFYVLGSSGEGMDGRAIEVFKYDGTPVARYQIDDKILSCFAVDEDNGYIYGYNSADPDNLLRYKMPR